MLLLDNLPAEDLQTEVIGRLAQLPLNGLIASLDRHRSDIRAPVEIALYRLWIDANTPDAPLLFAAWFNLGAAFVRAGDPAGALSAFQTALALNPDLAPAALNLGLMHEALDQREAAIEAYRQAIAVAPDMAAAHYSLAHTFMALGRYADAVEPAQAAARLEPRNKAMRDLLSRLTLEGIRRRLLREPSASEIWMELVDLCANAGWPEVAEGALATAGPDIQNSLLVCERLGMMYQKLGDFRQAAAVFERALQLTTEPALIWYRLGHVLAADSRVEAAEAAFLQAEQAMREGVRDHPDQAGAWSNLAFLLYEQGRPEEAVAALDAALLRLPDREELRQLRGTCLIAAGRELEGWPDYSRLLSGSGRGRPHPAPLWDGAPVPGQTLLITSDDGFGDFIQFCRFVPLAAARARVVLQVQPALLRLAATLPGPERLLATDDPEWPVAADVRCTLTAVVGLLAPSLPAIPAAVPYLVADPQRSGFWRERLQHLPGLRVGVVWRGDARLNWDFLRSLPVERLQCLADTPGVSFVSLQIGHPAPAWMFDPTAELHDFAETAALVGALDLVITIDSAMAHLAGALARPVWLLNRFSAEMRWQAHREDCPWYPTLRQFRQRRPGDWDEVLSRLRSALEQQNASRRTGDAEALIDQPLLQSPGDGGRTAGALGESAARLPGGG
jgi:tetratricopeptide (TPR) repeat protein